MLPPSHFLPSRSTRILANSNRTIRFLLSNPAVSMETGPDILRVRGPSHLPFTTGYSTMGDHGWETSHEIIMHQATISPKYPIRTIDSLTTMLQRPDWSLARNPTPAGAERFRHRPRAVPQQEPKLTSSN